MDEVKEASDYCDLPEERRDEMSTKITHTTTIFIVDGYRP